MNVQLLLIFFNEEFLEKKLLKERGEKKNKDLILFYLGEESGLHSDSLNTISPIKYRPRFLRGGSDGIWSRLSRDIDDCYATSTPRMYLYS